MQLFHVTRYDKDGKVSAVVQLLGKQGNEVADEHIGARFQQ